MKLAVLVLVEVKEVSLAPKFGVVEEVRYGLVACCNYALSKPPAYL